MFSLILIFVLHFIGDFLLQPYWMKIKKSRQAKVMFLHILLYFSVMVVGLSIFFKTPLAVLYGALNAIIHLVVDYASSRVISGSSQDLIVRDGPEPIYERVDMHIPILLLGIDQLIHNISLIVTWYYFF